MKAVVQSSSKFQGLEHFIIVTGGEDMRRVGNIMFLHKSKQWPKNCVKRYGFLDWLC